MSHGSLSLLVGEWFQVQCGPPLAAGPGLVSMEARACSRRGYVLQGRNGPRCQDIAQTEDTQVYKRRQLKEYSYSNGLAKYLARRQLNEPLWNMVTELWLPSYVASKSTFCSSEDR